MTIHTHLDPKIPPELELQYGRVLANLEANALSHGLNIELLRSRARVYSVRINQKARLLIAPYRELEKMSWVVLDCLEDHKYDSIYLRISQDELEQRILAICEARPFSASPAKAAATTADAEEVVAEPQELVFYQNMVIQLTTEQDEVVHASLPLVVNGVAGSGKTCVGLSILRQAALAWKEGAPPIVYVATSPKLVAQMESSYHETYGVAVQVRFLTYPQVLKQVLSDSFDNVDDGHLSEWLNRYIQNQKHVSKSPDYLTEELCREFRQVCIFSQCEDYLKIGARHSLLSEEDKTWVFTAYQAYRVYLNESKKFHLGLYYEEGRPLFSLVVADESQDLSPAALYSLSRMVPRGVDHAPQIVYLADANQSLDGNFLVLHHLIKIVGETNIKNLPVSHRSPLAVIEVANRLLALRNNILGGVYDKHTQSSLRREGNSEHRGEVRWTDSVQAEWFGLGERPDFAVVTSLAYQEEAATKFKTPLVFTPSQIKGLEYKYIVAYRLLEGERVKAINEQLRNKKVQSSSNRARRDELTQDNVPKAIYLNSIFTAFTRAIDTLIIFQAKEHCNQEIIHFLNPDSAKRDTQQVSVELSASGPGEGVDNHAENPSAKVDVSSIGAWKEELKRQEALGNHQIASDIQRKLAELTLSSLVRDDEKTAPKSPTKPHSLTAPPQQVIATTSIAVQKPTVKDGKISLADYLENFLKAMDSKVSDKNKINVKNFLESPRAYKMLLVHPMKNKKTLFENLIANSTYVAFKACMEGDAGLNNKYFSLLQQKAAAHIVAMILIFEWNICHKSIFERWKQNTDESTMCLRELAMIVEGVELLDRQWINFKPFLTPEVLNRPSEAKEDKGKSLLYYLAATTDGLKLLKNKWADIKSYLTVEGMNRPAEAGENKGGSPFCWLVCTPAGLRLLKDKWNDIKPYITVEGMNRPAENSPFSWLVCTTAGLQLLKDKWNDIKPYLTVEGMNRPAVAGENKGKNPLYWLAGLPEGRQLLKDKWEDIKPLLTREGLNRASEAGEYKGISSLYWLVCTPDGLQLVRDRWTDIKPYLTIEGMNRPPETGEHKGKNPLFWLAGLPEGCQLLEDKWADIKPYLTIEGLNRPAEAREDKGKSALYCFAGTSEGCQLLKDKWADIKPYLTIEGLNRSAEAGEDEGKSALYFIAGTTEGRQLLRDKWEDIKPYITIEGLNRHEAGESPFYFLAMNLEGLQFLNEKWEDLKSLLTLKELNRIREKMTKQNQMEVLPGINKLIERLSLKTPAADSKIRFLAPVSGTQDVLSTKTTALS
jgi:hypothetical protein